MLEPYRVLDLTDEKGQLRARILGDLGADVLKIEPPDGSSARALGPFYQDSGQPEQSLSWYAFNANKRGITLDLQSEPGRAALRRLVQTSHFLVESYTPGYLDSLGLGHAALSALNPSLIMVSITPFGQQGPHADWVTSDIVSMAMGGLMSVGGDPDRPPLRVSEPQAYLHAGAQAAAAALIAHYARLKTGFGQHADVSIQEAVMWVLSEVPQYWDLLGVNRVRTGARMPRGTTRANLHHPCQDGFVAFSVNASARGGPVIYELIRWMDREGMADALGPMKDWSEEEWLGLNDQVMTQEMVETVEAAIDTFFRSHTKLELHQWANRNGIQLYMVSDPKDFTENPQLEARGFFTELAHEALGTTIKYPGSWARSSAGGPALRRRAPALGEHNQEILGGELGLLPGEVAAASTPQPGQPAATATVGGAPAPTSAPVGASRPWGALAGLRVIEFAWVASGPTIGKHLSEHGAEVIRLESNTRLDNLRSYPPYPQNIPGPNRSGFFARYNANKKSVTLDLGTRRGLEIARKLVATADIVTESFSAGTIGRLGLGYRTLKAIKPDIIMLSTNIHGQTGPWAEQGGWGGVGAAVAGITHFVGWPDRDPIYVAVPYTDYVSPSFGVTMLMAALDHRDRTGEGQYIDLSQVECAIQFLGPAILDYTANGRIRQRRGNSSPDSAPHGTYPCLGDDRWCAIAVETEKQWQAFCQTLGEPEWTRDRRFQTMADRLAHSTDLDALIGGWTSQLEPEEVAQRLQAASVPAGMVQRGQDLFADPQLAARDHFVYLDHLEMGRHAYERMSYRLSRTPGQLVRAAPVLGQDVEQVLREVAGFSDEDLEQAMLVEAFG